MGRGALTSLLESNASEIIPYMYHISLYSSSRDGCSTGILHRTMREGMVNISHMQSIIWTWIYC
jgi:hypothetical protein